MNSDPASRRYVSQRLKLNYVEWGDKNAPVLLLIHGMRDHCRNWDWVAKALCNDYRIIAPDLRGHGDSEWMIGGSYQIIDFVADINQLVSQTTKEDEQISVLCHSFGGSVGLYYAGLFPDKIKNIAAIEGLGPPPQMLEMMRNTTVTDRLTTWVDSIKKSSARIPKKYDSLEDAISRMHQENSHLSDEQARHLSVHGINQNEDGTYTWKFDNYLRVMSPVRLSQEDSETLWSRINCPTLLLRGANSWAQPLDNDERTKHFKHAELVTIDDAGHWLHHDQLQEFLKVFKNFLKR